MVPLSPEEDMVDWFGTNSVRWQIKIIINESDNNTYTEIRRTSLRDLASLPALLSPAGDLDVIEIENDNLYYILYYSQTICYVPLSDLRELN